MQLYPYWYRRYGIRRVGELLAPVLKPAAELEFPRESMFHYFGLGVDDDGPKFTEGYFKNITRLIFVKHITELTRLEGNPRSMAINIETAIKNYHLSHRRCRRAVSDEQGLRDLLVPFVLNYSYIDRRYKYVRSMFSEYNAWRNKFASIMQTVNDYASKVERNQFIILNLPEVLPGLSQLNLACEEFDLAASGVAMEEVALEKMTQTLLRFFSNDETLFVMEIFKWLGDTRESSLMNVLDKANLHRINLIIKDGNKFVAINLNALEQWRSDPSPDVKRKALEPKQIRNRFLKLLMCMVDQRNGGPLEDKLAAQVKVDTNDEIGKDDTGVATDAEIVLNENGDVVNNSTVTKTEEPVADGDDLFVDVSSIDIEVPDTTIEDELLQLEVIMKEHAAQKVDEVRSEIFTSGDKSLEAGVLRKCQELSDQGVLSAAEYRKYVELSKSYQTMAVPEVYGGAGVVADFIKIDPTELQIRPQTIPDQKAVLDKSMLQSSLMDFDSRYIRNVLAKDIVSMVMNVQHAGICVTKYDVERTEDVTGIYDKLIIQLVPVNGSPSKLQIKIPVINEDGTYVANSIRYRHRKQRGDVTIRKIGADRVAITSYYGKTFVDRNSRSVNNYGRWVGNQLMLMALNDDSELKNAKSNAVYSGRWPVPRGFSTIAQRFTSFEYRGFAINLDYDLRKDLYGEEALRTLCKEGLKLTGNIPLTIMGKHPDGKYLLMDKDSALYTATLENPNEMQSLGTIEDFFNLPIEKAPIDFAEVKIMGKAIPAGVVLGYLLGFDKLLTLLNVKPRRVPAGERPKLETDEYAITFADETLVFSRNDTKASMILAGFNEYGKDLRMFSVYDFDRRAAYDRVLENNGLSSRYTKEIVLMNDLFVEPIARDLLKEMNEPTDFRGLIFRACEMLLTDKHNSEFAGSELRQTGYERIPGAIYSEIIKAVRAQNGNGRTKNPIDMSPYAVWRTITQDPVVQLVNEINPIEDLKQGEAITYSGNGGRNSRSMTQVTRQYHPEDMGTISEATVDSGDVGINIYSSYNPQLTSLRGLSKKLEPHEVPPSSLLSTAALLAPGSDRDDPKRVNFIGIQRSHMIPCAGYQVTPLRTGAETVVAHRNSELFASVAKKAGKVTQVTPTGFLVEYEDGSTAGFKTGRQFGSNAGMTIPHTVTTDLKVGESFKAGTVLAFNSGFYQRDIHDPTQVVMKMGVLATVALLESSDTLEDSCAISTSLASKLRADLTKVKTVVLNFDQEVRRIVSNGQTVKYDDPVCIIEDAVTANTGAFDEESYDTLRMLGANAPAAKENGVVERIEVYYNGDKEDMSETLARIADISDRLLARRRSSAGLKVVTGQVDEGFRVEGNPLLLDTVCIKFFITTDHAMSVGDKGVLANQMKTVLGRVMYEPVTTESGKEVDVIFGAKSIFDRIVTSPFLIGTTNTLLEVIGKQAAAMRKKN
jgi:hypothetical protein